MASRPDRPPPLGADGLAGADEQLWCCMQVVQLQGVVLGCPAALQQLPRLEELLLEDCSPRSQVGSVAEECTLRCAGGRLSCKCAPCRYVLQKCCTLACSLCCSVAA